MSSLCVDRDKCCNDGLCIAICPLKNFVEDKDGNIAIQPRAEERCINCGQCVAVCPMDAITLNGIDPTTLMESKMDVSFDQVMRLCKTRRSVRHFDPTPLPREILLQALEVARQAPSAYNVQPVRWLVLSDKEKIQALAKLTADTLRTTRKKFFMSLADVYDRGRDVMLRDAPQVIIAYGKEGDELLPHDSSAAISYLELSLHSMGIGTCWIGYLLRASYRNPAIADFLGLPYGYNLQAGLMVGKPIYEYRRVPARNPLEITWID